MALTGHSGMQTAQSMHSSGSMVRKFGPSRKQSTGQTSTQSVYLQRMHDSRTTWVMVRRLGCGAGSGVAAARNREFYVAEPAASTAGVAAADRTARDAAAMRPAPTPIVTTVGRPECSS